MIFQMGWAALAAIFTFSIAMVVWGRNGDGSIDMISFLNYESFTVKFLILTSFFLLVLITFAVIYISFISWKDKKRLKK